MKLLYHVGLLFPALLLLLIWINGVVLHLRSSLQLSHLLDDNNGGQPYRTGYHFQPHKNWMNDPNGPMIYKGIYHLFYQYNPDGPIWAWGSIVWGHSTSKDLVNWTPQPIALSPSMRADVQGCWSGSATILPDEPPAIFYTGGDPNFLQLQNLARPKDSSDPFLKEWVKSSNNPLISPSPTDEFNATEFRDPTTAWLLPDGEWRMAIGSKMLETGIAVLYKSRDFIHWKKVAHPLHSVKGTGIWECPDFYPVYVNESLGAETSVIGADVKHVLKVSLAETAHDCYTIGSYDIDKDVYTPDEGSVEDDSGLRYDYGKFYASKSFYDSEKKRRVVWAWVNESSSEEDDKKKGWFGIQAIPRTVVLDKDGKQLLQWPVEEIEMLREKRVDVPSKLIEGGSVAEVVGVTASQADVEVSFGIEDFSRAEKFESSWTDPQQLCSEKGSSVQGGIGPFGLLILASENLEEYTAVFFRIFRGNDNKLVVLMCSDQARSSLNPTTDKTTYGTFVKVDPSKENISLRSLVDHSVIENFGAKGKNCITSRVYPTLAIDDDAHLYAFNNGSTNVEFNDFRVWNMKKARIG